MTERLAADAVLLLHFAFVLFVAFGGLVALRWPRVAILHLPAVIWGVYISVTGRLCPLTTIENRLRRASGDTGYEGGFIDQYIAPILYPPGLTRSMQFGLAAVLIAINVAVYAWLIVRRRR